ncbi:MAG: hypothetical protein ABJ308_08070 [Halieaceae bacterium]
MRRLLTIVILAFLFTACEQATVQGPIGGASVTVADLRSGEILLSGELTDDLASVESSYDNVDDFLDLNYLTLLGVFDLLDLPLDPQRYYLVTLQGGFDYDSNGDLVVDDSPSAVIGPVRALMTGAQLQAGAHMYGSLSEAAWQWVREHYAVMSDAELTAALDEYARSLVLDVRDPGLGIIDYDDLLTWNPLYYSSSLYKGSASALEAMIEAIASGASDSERLAIAREMTTLLVPSGASDAWFEQVVSPDVAQAKCLVCHGNPDIAGLSEHSLVADSDPDHLAINDAMYSGLVESLGVESILSLTTGVGHQGGLQLAIDSPEYDAFETYLNLLAGSNSGGEVIEDLLAGYTLSSAQDSLRRASMLLAGVLPDDEDLAAVANGDDDTLRFMIRFLMQGEGFHNFLIEGANDRLLTDKWIEDTPVTIFFQPFYPDLVNQAASLGDAGQMNELNTLIQGTSFGIARQPLELIAHVVEQELPYTEILTAQYTMVNPQLALAYRSGVSFDSDQDIDQWQVGTVQGYTRYDASTTYEEAEVIGAYVSGGLPTDYPQAGVLNTPGWLSRYPSTDTNRNRARSRWTWYHFLGFDIERSAPRTTDPDALADTDNPTLKNPNCTVCHETMDPVAAAYQNYGDEGFYKDQFGGADSLPILYKRDQDAEDPYQFGDVWYKDMREPGFDGQQFGNTESTVQDLAAALSEDYRFGTGTVKFWWPALMGEEAALAPEDESDFDYAERLALFQSQSADIDALASGFITGFNGGAPYNLKDLLVEMILSPWFRIDSAGPEVIAADSAMLDVGTGKLLTPEQLDRKTEAVTGYRWFEQEYLGVDYSQLTSQYRLFYGGIDSDGVTRRATEMTSLMTTVVEAQPLQMGCVLVAIEFQYPQANRLMFSKVNKNQHESNAEQAVREQLAHLHQRFLGETVATDDPEVDRALALFTETRAERIELAYPTQLNGSDQESCPFQPFDTAGWDLSDPQHTLNTWISMLIYYMTDYRYVYE